MSDRKHTEDRVLPEGTRAGKITRGALQVAGGAIPLVGGTLSAISSAWSEAEQEKVNRFFDYWIQMLKDELKEKEQTIVEIMARIDLADEKIVERIESSEFQSLVRKTFREWSGAESEEKRVYIRNILANAAAVSLTSDDVIRLFITWINQYSEMHFQVIGAIYNSDGITRGAIWKKLEKARSARIQQMQTCSSYYSEILVPAVLSASIAKSTTMETLYQRPQNVALREAVRNRRSQHLMRRRGTN